MRIGIDTTCWANERGYGRYTRELLAAMAPQARAHTLVCFLDDLSFTRFDLAAPHIEPVRVPLHTAPTVAAASGGGRSPFDMLRLTQAVRRAGVDVFFSPSVYGFFPLPPGLPAAITIHDAIAERFPALTLPTWRDRLFWRLKVSLALKQADVVLTVSSHAADQISRYLGVPRERLRVTLEGVASAYRPSDSPHDIAAAARRAGLPEDARWIIYVGGFGPHKHVDVLARAHAALVARGGPPLYLLLVGPNQDAFHQDLSSIRDAIAQGGSERFVKWLGYLPDEELRHLHSGAVALVLASAAEGFGLPAVEAARCGTPVVATIESPLPEVLEGGGLFVAPGDAAALELALATLLGDEPARRAMGARALARASALSWDRSAAVALGAIEDAAGARGRKIA